MEPVRRISVCVILFLCLCATVAVNPAVAQWNIGASYEVRNEAPENGFGLRLEREILNQLPLSTLRIRGHFSYFQEENFTGDDGLNYDRIKNYDFGVAAVGGISVGLLTPYIGTGVGSTTTDLGASDVTSAGNESDSSIFWNGFVGAELSPIPALKPFVEYRYQTSGGYRELRDIANRSKERLIFGLSISF